MGKKKKDEYIDDGHTVYNMDIEGFRWHDRKARNANKTEISKKERRALIRSAYKSYLPPVLMILLGFSLAAVLLYFWLR